jgi:hypothetical protein
MMIYGYLRNETESWCGLAEVAMEDVNVWTLEHERCQRSATPLFIVYAPLSDSNTPIHLARVAHKARPIDKGRQHRLQNSDRHAIWQTQRIYAKKKISVAELKWIFFTNSSITKTAGTQWYTITANILSETHCRAYTIHKRGNLILVRQNRCRSSRLPRGWQVFTRINDFLWTNPDVNLLRRVEACTLHACMHGSGSETRQIS